MSTGELQGLYQQVILDHAREKHGFGLLEGDDARSHQVNPTCGDEITLQVHLAPCKTTAVSAAAATPPTAAAPSTAAAPLAETALLAETAPLAVTAPRAATDQRAATAPVGSPPRVIASVHWEGQGCSISQASASLLSDLAAGVDVPDMRERVDAFRLAMRSKGMIEPDEDLLGDAVVLGGTSRYIARVKCAMLAWVALEDALLHLPAAP